MWGIFSLLKIAWSELSHCCKAFDRAPWAGHSCVHLLEHWARGFPTMRLPQPGLGKEQSQQTYSSAFEGRLKVTF